MIIMIIKNDINNDNDNNSDDDNNNDDNGLYSWFKPTLKTYMILFEEN